MLFDLVILLMIMIIIIIINNLKFKKFFTFNIIFSLVWIITLLVNIIYSSIYNTIVPSTNVIIMVTVSIIFFNFIYILLSKKHYLNYFNIQDTNINYKFLKIGFYIALILLLPNIINGIMGIITSVFSLSNIRADYSTTIGSGKGVYVYLTNIIPSGIINAFLLIVSYELVKGRKNFLPHAIILLVSYVISFGGRTMVYSFVLFYVICFFLLKQKYEVKLNKKIVIFGLIILLILTFSRGLGENSLIEIVSDYFFQQFSFFQYILNESSMFDLSNSLHYGTITFGFIFSPIYLVLSIFFPSINLPSYYVDINSQIFYNIGTNGNFKLINNNTTSIYPFMLDYGGDFYFIGFIVMALMLVFVTKKIKNNNRNNFFYFLLYVFLLKNIVYSPISYGLYGISSSFTLVFIFVFTRKSKFVFK